MPVLVTLGVRSDGEQVVLDMRIAGDESTAAWVEVVADLAKCHLRAPVLAVIDGNPGLPEALSKQWPKIEIHAVPSTSCAAVVRSLEEAVDELFAFLHFPKSQWRALRTTNALERINEEFRRRTKTQASLPNEDAVLLLLFGLLRSGKVKMRKIDGWEQMPKRERKCEAA